MATTVTITTRTGVTTYEVSTGARGPEGVTTAASINDALEGETLLLDYFQTTDRAGESNPAGSYGQKSGEPYFGDDLLASRLRNVITFAASAESLAADGILSLAIGGFSVPASDAVSGTQYDVTLKLLMDSSGAGTLPAATDKIYLFARFGAGTPVLADGFTLEITPLSLCESREIRLVISFSELGGFLRVAGTVLNHFRIGSTAPDTDGVAIPFITSVITTGANVGVEGVATTLQFYIVQNNTVGSGSITNIQGSLELLRGITPASGTLA